MTPNPAFKGTQLFDVGFLRNDTGWTHGNYRPLKPGTVHTGNKVDSSRSTLLKVNKVDRVEFNFVMNVYRALRIAYCNAFNYGNQSVRR